MQLPEIAIRRPVFATVLSLLVVLVGAVSFTRLSVREYPKIDEPVVTVSVNYPGAAAEVRDRTARVRSKLPDTIDEPVIAKVEADAFPILWLAFTSDTLTPLQI